MLKKSCAAVALALGLMSSAAFAVDVALIGLWNVPDNAGTLEIREDGTFTGKVKGGADFSGKWVVGPSGVMSLVRDDGQSAKCSYTLQGDTLTFSDCPLAGAFQRAQ